MKSYMYYAAFLVIAVLCSNLVDAENWSYKNEDKWSEKCLFGRKQSPINLQKDAAVHHSFTDLYFRKYDLKYNASVSNTGHSVAVRLNGYVGPSVKGGGLPYEYIFDHAHFHWESEHTIHSNRFPLELHLVHYANIYNSVESALEHKNNSNSLAVLGVLFDFSDDDEDNPTLEPFLDKINEIRYFGSNKVDLERESVRLSDLLPKDIYTFFRYEGSLTTPSCAETVVWTVFYQHNFISKRQFADFHKINTAEGPLTANYRTLQNLNDRIVVFRNAASLNLINCSCIIALIIFYSSILKNNIFL